MLGWVGRVWNWFVVVFGYGFVGLYVFIGYVDLVCFS